MWKFFVISVCVVSACSAYTAPNYCADLNPQPHINIDRLMGMWYAVEIISHQPNEEYYVRRVASCPIIHISEDRTSTSTYNPLHRDYNYNYNYGQGHGDYNPNTNYNNYRTTQGRNDYNRQYDYNRINDYNRGNDYRRGNDFTRQYDYNRPTTDYNYNRNTDRYGSPYYDRSTTDRYGRYGSQYYDRTTIPYYDRSTNPYYDRSTNPYYDRSTNPYYDRTSTYGYGTTSYPSYTTSYYDTTRYGEYYGQRARDQWKRLRLWWDENGSSTEYHLRYNATAAGFWYSSGPNNGSSVDPMYSHFAGAIQIIKAVGDHLVLSFCHSLPDRKLFTVILSRENYLDPADIYGVHGLLRRKGLNTNNVKKVCGSGNVTTINTFLMFCALTIAHYLVKI